jgi:hypothetical protein
VSAASRVLNGAARSADADQETRWEQFERDRPDAVIAYEAGQWRGSLTVCRKRIDVTHSEFWPLLDELGELAALDTEALAIERDFPSWRLWLSSANRWWATWQGPDAVWTRDGKVPITIDADDLAGLRDRLAAAQAVIDAAEDAGRPA